LYKAFDARIVVGYPLPSLVSIVVVNATIIAFFKL